MSFLVAHMANDRRESNFQERGEEEAHSLPPQSPVIDLESPTFPRLESSMEAVESTSVEVVHERMASSGGALTKIVAKPSASRPIRKRDAGPMDDYIRQHLEQPKLRAKEKSSERMSREVDSLSAFFNSMYLMARSLPYPGQIEARNKTMHVMDEMVLKYHSNPGPSSTPQYQQLQTVRAPVGVPEYTFTGQAGGGYPSAPPSTSTAYEGGGKHI